MSTHRYTGLAFALLAVLALFSSFPAPPAVAATDGTVFTTEADLAAAEARARTVPLSRLARQSLLATAARIVADGGRLGDGRFAREHGALVLAYAYRSTGDVAYAKLAAAARAAGKPYSSSPSGTTARAVRPYVSLRPGLRPGHSSRCP